MPGLLILAHAPLASSLRAVAAHVFPNEIGVEAVDVAADDPLDRVEEMARELLARVRDPEALILTDVFGATPCNVAMRLAEGPQVRVVTGVSVPMLWRAIGYRHEPLVKLVERAIAGGVQGVMQLSPTRPQMQGARPTDHDQDRTQDQQ
jgi:PTS system ascorbate-specific IIA component